MSSHQHREITLLGAGLVGSLLAIYLAKRGYQVTIFEKRTDMRKADISAGRSINLALAKRGILPLEQLGLLSKVEALWVPMQGRMLHHSNGSTELFAYGQREDEVIYSISRGELNQLLMNEAEATGQVKIHFEHSCQSIDLDNKTCQISHAEAHLTHHFQRIIGADGAGSALRTEIVKKTSCDYSEDMLEHGYKELLMPATIKSEYAMLTNALHVWPRGEYMLIALPNNDASFTLTLFMPNDGEPSFASLDQPEQIHTFFASTFSDSLEWLPNLEQNFLNNPVGRLGTVRCQQWHYREHALLIGDAAHAIVPFHGQGMNCGFEDCSALNGLLDQHQDDWAKVIPEFESTRIPNANAIADMALENYIEMRDTVRDQSFQDKKAIAFELERLHPKRFIPRYSMVMFHSMDYAEAQRRGKIQNSILDFLIQNGAGPDNYDKPIAAKLIEKKLNVIE